MSQNAEHVVLKRQFLGNCVANTHGCLNGGVCVERYNGYTCDCSSTAYCGARCDEGLFHTPSKPINLIRFAEIGFKLSKDASIQYNAPEKLQTARLHFAFSTRVKDVTILAGFFLPSSTFNLSLGTSTMAYNTLKLGIDEHERFFMHISAVALGEHSILDDKLPYSSGTLYDVVLEQYTDQLLLTVSFHCIFIRPPPLRP